MSGSSRTGLRVLDLLLRPVRALRLAPTRLDLPDGQLPHDEPILLVANHVSWWDGFLCREVHERLRPRDPFCIVMTDRELRRRPWLRTLGAVGLDPASPGSVRTAFRELARRRAASPRTLFVFFPQGAIAPSSRRPLGFQRGIETVSRMLSPVSVVPAALHIEPLDRSVPTPFISLGRHVSVARDDSMAASCIERLVQEELDSLIAFLERHGENADTAWPARTRAPGPSPLGVSP